MSASAPPLPAHSLVQVMRDGSAQAIARAIAEEVPLSIEYGGIAYAVMMVTPADLEDYVLGFSLSEQLITTPADIIALEITALGKAWIARVTLRDALMHGIFERARMRVSEGSCGLCGLENLEQVMRPLPVLDTKPTGDTKAIFAALDSLPSHQPLTQATGAAHAAAFCNAQGDIHLAREDIGRHNALDKLVGAMSRAEIDPAGGFILLTARCSYELIEKAILARCPMLVTISAPSTLAIERARAHGLSLISLARADSVLVAHDPYGLFASSV